MLSCFVLFFVKTYKRINCVTLKSVVLHVFPVCGCVCPFDSACVKGGYWWQGYLEKDTRETSSSWSRHKAAGSGLWEGQDNG